MDGPRPGDLDPPPTRSIDLTALLRIAAADAPRDGEPDLTLSPAQGVD